MIDFLSIDRILFVYKRVPAVTADYTHRINYQLSIEEVESSVVLPLVPKLQNVAIDY